MRSSRSQEFPSRQLDCIRLLPLLIDEFQPHFWAAICAEETEALRSGFTCGWKSIYFLNNEPSRQTCLSCGRFWIDLRNPERVRLLIEIERKSETHDLADELSATFFG
jgi:hypothetical protein